MNDPTSEFQAVVVEGITQDYVWYEASVLSKDILLIDAKLKRLVSVMEARHKEHTDMLQQLMDERRSLKQRLGEES